MPAEGFMALTHHAAKGNYTWLRNQLSSPIIEIVILHPGKAVHLHTFGHHDLPSLIQFLGYKAKLRASSVNTVNRNRHNLRQVFRAVNFEQDSRKFSSTCKLRQGQWPLFKFWKIAALFKAHCFGSHKVWLAKMACWVIRRPINPWHFARIFLIPHLLSPFQNHFDLDLDHNTHLIVETNQYCLHLRVSRGVPTQQSLKASDGAILFRVGL